MCDAFLSEVDSYEVPRTECKRLAVVMGDPDGGPISLSTASGVVKLPKTASADVRRLLEELAADTSVHLIAQTTLFSQPARRVTFSASHAPM